MIIRVIVESISRTVYEVDTTTEAKAIKIAVDPNNYDKREVSTENETRVRATT